jgi:hypothetical protein
MKLGFAFTTDIKEILQERFKTEENPEECVTAMQAIKEFRPLSLSTYQDWKAQLTQRFGPEVMKTCKIATLINQEVLKRNLSERREEHRPLVLISAIEDHDQDWRNRVEDWLQEAKEAYRIGFRNVYEHWLQK